MKKVSLLALLLSGCVGQAFAEIPRSYGYPVTPTKWSPYVEASGGISALSDNLKTGSALEVRGGAYNDRYKLSYGYLRQEGDTEKNLLPATLTLHTLNLGIERVLPLPMGFKATLGAFGGVTVPNFESNAQETASNGLSGVFSGGLDYQVTPSLSLGLKTSYFVFRTDSHRTVRTTETETVFQGGVPIGSVEVENEVSSQNSLNFNSLMVTAGLVYKF